MKKAVMALAIATGMSMAGCTGTKAQTTATDAQGKELPKVYFIKEITPENIVKIYNALGRKAQGKNVAVKLSTGEAGNPNHLSPALIKDLVQSVNGTIIEGNTAYAGRRNTTADHLKTAEEHGFTAIADVDILDADGQVSLPIEGGRHLKEDIVGKNFLNYDFLMVLSHFKGHPMGGFGGALKNISIGIASPDGKANIHSAGKTQDVAKVWDMIPVAEPEPVSMADIGIFASLDPVALDRACIDAVRNSDDHGKIHLIERIDSRHGMHNLEYAEQLGLGSQTYELVELK